MTEHFSLQLLGCDGSTWHIEGDGVDDEGVFLLPKPQQFYHSPAVTYWIKSGGAGEKYQGFSYASRKPLFALVAHDTDPEAWRALWSELTLAFGTPDDTFRLRAETNDGVRYLRMRLRQHLAAFEAIEPIVGMDPHLYGCGSVGVDAQCEMPHWYGDALTGEWSLPSGTSGSTSTLPHPGNPGSVPSWPKWTLEAPATWSTIPDRSYGQEDDFGRFGEDDSANTWSCTPLIAGEDLLVDSNPDEEAMITIDGSLGPLMRQGGDLLVYPVAARTAPHNVTVAVSGATAGVTATIEVIPLYDTPFGRGL